MKFCPYCDYTAIDQTDSFCQQCGHNLVQDTILTSIYNKTDSSIFNESKLAHYGLLLGLLLEISLLFTVWFFSISYLIDLFSLVFFIPFVFIFGNNFIHDLRISSRHDKILSGIFNISLIVIIVVISFFLLFF